MPPTTGDESQVPHQKIVDLNAFSKEALVHSITDNIDELQHLLELSEVDYARGAEVPLRIFGLSESGLFEERELLALLSKFIPKHLLIDIQDIKGIAFHQEVLIPYLDENNKLKEKSVIADTSQTNYRRTLCIKRHDEPLLNVYSPKGLSNDNRVLKLVMLNAILHDFGHGIIDYYFSEYGRMSTDDPHVHEYYNWIIQLGLIYGYGTPLSQKSAGYLVDMDAASNATTPDEKAQIGIERAQEDFAEAVRLKCLYPNEYTRAVGKPGNRSKHDFLEQIWKK